AAPRLTRQCSWIDVHFPALANKEPETALLAFLQAMQHQPGSNRLLQLLKCVHQEMPFGAITAMKSRIGSRFPYKDVRGTWHVSIVIKEDSVLVRHHKTEQAAAL